MSQKLGFALILTLRLRFTPLQFNPLMMQDVNFNKIDAKLHQKLRNYKKKGNLKSIYAKSGFKEKMAEDKIVKVSPKSYPQS